ncbi:sigma-70 family RNA polymerase sigma factor [Candidatus Poribacteria bacterium]|nr:sigma-70 family RNA polymerase sigma factor [Candidatus Poribacteria bacterium]
MEDLSDAQLINQTLSGDDQAFEILVGRYQSAVFRWIRQTLPDTRYDEDLAQEAFIEAYFNLDTLREPCKFKGWLKQIARNVCVSWLRRQRQVVSYEEIISHDEMQKQMEFISSHYVPTPEELLMEQETFADLRNAICCLSEVHQEILRLYYFEGLTYQEISGMLNISESAIKSRLHRAREQLKGVKSNARE